MRTRWPGRLVHVALFLALLVGGCGEDEDDGSRAEEEAALAADCERAGGRLSAAAPEELEACARGVEGDCALRGDAAIVACELPPSTAMCGDSVSVEELLLMLNGAVVAAAEQIDDGVSVYELFGGVIVGMLYNGIDWNQLDDLEVDFDAETGSYMIESGASRVGFRLYWARDFDGHSTGEPIPHNVFALTSYVSGIDVDIGGSIANPRIEYDYDEGPLFGLIDGGVEISGRDPRSLRIFTALHADAIAVELDSLGRRRFELPVPWALGLVTTKFDYETHILSTRTPVPDLHAALQGGGFALDLAGTVFARDYYVLETLVYGTRDHFEATDFAIKKDDDGAFFEGEYTGRREVSAQVLGFDYEGSLHSRGLLSNRQQNWTEFFCDTARTDLWGTARHDLDLEGGVFTFDSGRSFRYGTGEFEWEEDQVED